MRELWLETLELFRRRPVLWVPVCCADLVSHTGRQFWPILRDELAAWSMQTTSVLGGTTYRPQPLWLAPVAGLLRFVLEWVGACVYILAALVVARIVRQIVLEEKTESSLASSSGSILWLGSLTLVLSGLLALGGFSLIYFGVSRWFGSPVATGLYAISALPAYFVVAYVVAPQMVKLIGRDQHTLVTPDMLGVSRKVGLLVAVLLIALSWPIDRLKLPWPHPLGEVVLFSYLRSLAEALPFIPLFIAMGLLVCGSGADTGVEAPANPVEQATANADSL